MILRYYQNLTVATCTLQKFFPTSTYEEIIYGIDMPLELTSNLIHVTITRSTKHPLRALIRGA